MPKNRKQTKRKGAKSIAIRTKHKIGGRKSSKGLKQMSKADLLDACSKARPRDQQKAWKELNFRLQTNVWADCIGA